MLIRYSEEPTPRAERCSPSVNAIPSVPSAADLDAVNPDFPVAILEWNNYSTYKREDADRVWKCVPGT